VPPDPAIDVILPALDEARAIPRVLESLPSRYRPIVVDNGSTDGSGAIAAAAGALVIDEPRRGFGAACWAGLVAATSDVVCFMDCDGSLLGPDLDAVADPVVDDRADLVVGCRRATAGAWPIHARVANHAIAAALRHRCGVRLSDLGPMRAARREPLLLLGIEDRRFGWPLEMVMRAAAAGWRIDEVGVHYQPRLGRSKVTGTVLGTIRAARDMAAVAAPFGGAR
jgi:glycosyltransferase involved in cell wall biosynthesis